jgi:predicted transcriptional regulator
MHEATTSSSPRVKKVKRRTRKAAGRAKETHEKVVEEGEEKAEMAVVEKGGEEVEVAVEEGDKVKVSGTDFDDEADDACDQGGAAAAAAATAATDATGNTGG